MRRFFIFKSMKHDNFLDRFAQEVYKNHGSDLEQVLIVLPNKRAKVFLIEALKNKLDAPAFAPEIISIEEFIARISGLQSIDSIELLFVFYEVYKTSCLKLDKAIDSFDVFSSWATMLLADFNEIDRYLLDTKHVFSYLKNIDDIHHWAVDADQHTPMIENYLRLWDLMPLYYKELHEWLLKNNLGYQGMQYRVAVSTLANSDAWPNKSLYFAGFNALNKAEEHIFQFLLNEGVAKVFWDIDKYFYEDSFHEAGYFARKTFKNWNYYKNHQIEWMVDCFSESKNIEIISTPKSVGQAKIAGSILEKISQSCDSLQNVALVLAEEKLLLPVLYALPKAVGGLNITMGYESKSNPMQLFVQKWFKMHLNAFKRNSNSQTFYFKEVLDVFSHPFLAQNKSFRQAIYYINKNNLSFFSLSSFEKIFKEDLNLPIVSLVVQSWNASVSAVLEQIIKMLFYLKEQFEKEEDTISLTFLFAVYTTIVKIQKYVEKYDAISNLEQLYRIYTQMIELSEVSFEGEPLEGLQIMGVLESRVLDFETVIITSVNEGILPAGKSNASFIPHDVKLELGLPTFREKDAIYSYHFYHLLQRAKNIYILYNSDSSGFDAGEKSRFVTQLQLQPHPNHKVVTKNYFASIPKKANELIEVDKSKLLQEKLEYLAKEKGLSPSAFSNYLRNPIDFYFQNILGIRKVDEVEENIAANTLGNIVHNSLEELYKPFVGKFLQINHIKEMIGKCEKEVDNQFALEFNNSASQQGKNLLALEVSKKYVKQFLLKEQKALELDESIQIVALESKLEACIEHKRLPYPVKVIGRADRIEIRNGHLRIIDYKTGKVESNHLKMRWNDDIISDAKYDKVIQLILYAIMYPKEQIKNPLETAIYSFKNTKEGFMKLTIVEDKKNKISILDAPLLEKLKEPIVDLILKILNPDLPFIEQEK